MVKEWLDTPSLSTIEVGAQTGTKADGTPARPMCPQYGRMGADWDEGNLLI